MPRYLLYRITSLSLWNYPGAMRRRGIGFALRRRKLPQMAERPWRSRRAGSIRPDPRQEIEVDEAGSRAPDLQGSPEPPHNGRRYDDQEGSHPGLGGSRHDDRRVPG